MQRQFRLNTMNLFCISCYLPLNMHWGYFVKMWMSKWCIQWFFKGILLYIFYSMVNNLFSSTIISIQYFARRCLKKNVFVVFIMNEQTKSSIDVNACAYFQLTFLHKTIKYENKSEQLQYRNAHWMPIAQAFYVQQTRENVRQKAVEFLFFLSFFIFHCKKQHCCWMVD